MIASCPACSTTYRYRAVPAAAPARGNCSGCGERFPLASARRGFVVLAAPRAEAADGDPAPPARPRVSALLCLLAGLVLTGGLGAGAFFAAAAVPADPLPWTAAGAFAGLLVSWASVRWMRRLR